MLLKDYLAEIYKTIDEFTQTGLILSSDVITDFRTEKIGFIKGSVSFIDGSILFFKEYLDVRYRLIKPTYSFHYQDPSSLLRFRYDNALHKPDPGFHDHKHTTHGLSPSTVPDLRKILEEIVHTYFPNE
jgi:hypothetical protein